MSDLDRITELETRVAFQEETLDKLNEVVGRQELEIERLTRMVKLINGQLKQFDNGYFKRPEDETPPPHY